MRVSFFAHGLPRGLRSRQQQLIARRRKKPLLGHRRRAQLIKSVKGQLEVNLNWLEDDLGLARHEVGALASV